MLSQKTFILALCSILLAQLPVRGSRGFYTGEDKRTCVPSDRPRDLLLSVRTNTIVPAKLLMHHWLPEDEHDNIITQYDGLVPVTRMYKEVAADGSRPYSYIDFSTEDLPQLAELNLTAPDWVHAIQGMFKDAGLPLIIDYDYNSGPGWMEEMHDDIKEAMQNSAAWILTRQNWQACVIRRSVGQIDPKTHQLSVVRNEIPTSAKETSECHEDPVIAQDIDDLKGVKLQYKRSINDALAEVKEVSKGTNILRKLKKTKQNMEKYRGDFEDVDAENAASKLKGVVDELDEHHVWLQNNGQTQAELEMQAKIQKELALAMQVAQASAQEEMDDLDDMPVPDEK